MQAIITKFFGPTDCRGARIKAQCCGGQVTVPYDYALDSYDNHRETALKLAVKLEWLSEQEHHRMVGGSLPSGAGYAFVITFVPEERPQRRRNAP
jgi:hypothetical protein